MMDLMFWSFVKISSPTSMFDIFLFWRFSRKLLIWLRPFLFMLMTAFGFNSFPNTNLGFLGLHHLWLWFILRNPRWTGQTGCNATSIFAFVLLPPERRSTRISFRALARGFLINKFGLRQPITAWPATSGKLLQGLLVGFSITDFWATGAWIELSIWSIKSLTTLDITLDKVHEDRISINISMMDGIWHSFIFLTPCYVVWQRDKNNLLAAPSYSRLYSSSRLSRATIWLGFEKSVMITWFSSPAESPICVDAFYGPTHDRARSRGARRSSLQHLLCGVVRPVRGTGQTGRRAERRRSVERSPGRDPVGASMRTVALGSAGQQEHLQMPWRREKNSMSRLKK